MIKIYGVSEKLTKVAMMETAYLELSVWLLSVLWDEGNRIKLFFNNRKTFFWDSEAGTVGLFKKCPHYTILVEPESKVQLRWYFLSWVTAGQV